MVGSSGLMAGSMPWCGEAKRTFSDMATGGLRPDRAAQSTRTGASQWAIAQFTYPRRGELGDRPLRPLPAPDPARSAPYNSRPTAPATAFIRRIRSSNCGGSSDCGAVGERLLGMRVHLDHQRRRRRRRRRRAPSAATLSRTPVRVRRVDDRPAGARAAAAPARPLRSSVLRVQVSNVRMPRSHSITCVLPPASDVLGGHQPLLDRAPPCRA